MSPRKLVLFPTPEHDAPESRTMRASRLRLAALLAALGALAGSLALASRAEAFVYWGESSEGIGRADLDGSNVESGFIGSDACGVGVDGSHIYWGRGADWGTGAGIGRANLDGTGVESFISLDFPDFACGVAIDGEHIYWIGGLADSSIGRANLNGTGVDPDFIPLSSAVRPGDGLAVDGSHVYWSDTSEFGAAIGRANLNGTGVDEDFIPVDDYVSTPEGPVGSIFNQPRGVAVDGAHVYWARTNSVLEGVASIGRANVNGTGVDRNFIQLGDDEPCGIAVDASHVYWTQPRPFRIGGDAIGRANLNGTGVDRNLISPDSGVGCGVAVDSLSSPPSPPSNDFSFGKVKRNKRKGTAKLTVEIVEGPGELELAKTKKVKLDDEAVEGEGATEEKLAIKPKGEARKRLNEKGKAKVNAQVTYTPDGGEPNTESKKVRLVKR